ncbi:Piso0_003147 [Millerozyma farinosa CBS 7064]|uniref:Piso0_003147 protein n=1 Tax=Pichia sorbitophila (strain ATCC MYA-4447 / BCRC 22081 / CBS 7064 / NBRC 10061 / NRRL Y-12695) TaxID=559304 RepID=G8YHB3_PICSO|nr:Piso0_003147 [Millerozyma farinosa CBS 7064]CCE80815.1 Piso0_003147 [Millerozyma farinosa CBS 7064]
MLSRNLLSSLRTVNFGRRILRGCRFQHSVVGIDLGTTNSAVAVVEAGQAKILENEEGHRTTPSIVAFAKKGDSVETLVGLPAKRQAAVNPQNTFSATKRLIGRKFNDEEVQRDVNNSSYSIIEHENGDAWVSTSEGRKFSPTQISGMILEKMKDVAENQLPESAKPVRHAVVTVPAYFNDAQRQATKNAGKIVGLEILRVINEPTAAALAYGIDKKQKDGIVAVYDLGGGTFDISILDIDGGVFEVRATNGNTHLGGEDFDILLTNHIVNKVREEHQLDISSDRIAIQRVREAAEKAKIELSHVKKTTINLPFLSENVNFKMDLTEDELDNMSLHLINRTIDPVKRCIKDADLKVDDIDEVILVGGMTRMPKIRKTVESLFKKKPSTEVNPDEAVALGAAIQGAVLSGHIKNVVLLDVTPLSLGIETYGGIFSPLIPRNSSVPVKKEQVFSTAVDGQTGVEIRVYQGERPLVKDNKLIGNFTLKDIPVAAKGVPQIGVCFEIDADGIINVTASDKTPNKDGTEKKKNSVSIQVSGATGLSEQEINEMIIETNRNSKKDEETKRHIENATRADIICSDMDNALIQFGSFMEDSDKEKINEQLSRLREMINDVRSYKVIHNPQLIRSEVEKLQKLGLEAIQKVAAKQNQGKK